MTDDKWHWQEYGSAWHGIGIYHITMVVATREPVLGTLVYPNDNPIDAKVELTPFGEQIKTCVYSIPLHHPEIQIIGLRMMPDHVHFILHVTRTMPVSIKTAIRGFWQGAKALGRAYSLSVAPNVIRDNQQCPHPVFSEKPFIRPLSRRGQLDTMMQYIKMNPQRLATKRLKPGFFRVQHDVEINGHCFDAVGNLGILLEELRGTVHVRRTMVEAAEHGDHQPLCDYVDGCMLAARKGTVMVSPFISPQEKSILALLLQERLPVIYLAINGFGEYYKPSSSLFDACAEGRLLILSPWLHDPGKKHITRSECVALNDIAYAIAGN